MPTSTPISHVSDTAHWVAMYRAMESERPDALFRDPHARRLAGPPFLRGLALGAFASGAFSPRASGSVRSVMLT